MAARVIDAEAIVAALEQEARTAKLEAEHIAEYDPLTLSPLWLLASFKLLMADALYRVARSVREGVEA